ncbi:hypothetical protein NC652_000376 [Populus alba x Populus x berolinensis]|nr:hypothetical protein NC652_000376 [Populus alba x Populus x berolinensis]
MHLYLKIQNLTNLTLGSISISNPYIQARKHIGLREKLAKILKNENSFVNNQIDLGPNCSYLKPSFLNEEWD